MEPLYLGPRYWPIEPPLRLLQAHGEVVGILLPVGDITPANQALLEKILAAVRWRLEEATLFETQISLRWGRLALLPYQHLWIFGKSLLSVPVGIYETHTGQRLTQLSSSLTQIAWRLPTLSDMQNNPSAKQEAWQWLKLLASKS